MNVKGLDNLIKALKEKPPTARVGVLGNKAPRIPSEDSGQIPNNAEVGVVHEFGNSEHPQRSFLRIPISENLQDYMEKSGALDKETTNEVVKNGSVVPWLKKIAVLAEGIVLDAFDSGGFGKWKPSNMKFKKNQQTLVETQQLRNSITSEVKS